MSKRIILIIFTFTILLFIIGGRLFYLQITNGTYSGRGLAQKALKFRSQSLPGEEYYRGEILDRHLISLTDSGLRSTLVAFPNHIKNMDETCYQLENIFAISKEESKSLINRHREKIGQWAPLILKTNLNTMEIEEYQKTEIPGVVIIPLKTRYGPRSLAKHIIGYLNSIDSTKWQELTREQKTVETNNFLPTIYALTDKIGVAGLEKKYEGVLRGSQAEKQVISLCDANGRFLESLGYRLKEEQVDPWRNHLVLTIDRKYQEIVEQIMDQKIKRGAVVVIDLPTGDLLALASRPNFDQNQVEKYLDGFDELLDRTNRVAFYPGSVFKVVIAIGALEENLVTLDEKFICSGKYVFPDQTEISCLGQHGAINLKEALMKSCNTTFIQLGLRLGNDQLRDYAHKLGFTVKIEQQSPPALLANASLGQEGVLVSPLQIANLYATIGRGGYVCAPRLVAQIRNFQGVLLQEFTPVIPQQVIQPDTCAFLKEALAEVCRRGTGKQAWLMDKGTAGKTGTAQTNAGGKLIAWFAGFTPLENPRLAIAVLVEEKEDNALGRLTGGEDAAPIFREIAEEILALMDNITVQD